MDRAPALDKVSAGQEDEGVSMNRFKKLFGQSDKYSSTAAAKVIQSNTSASKKLW